MNHLAIQQGNVAVITGAGAGIGFAIARTLARVGMKIVMFDKCQQALDEAQNIILQELPQTELLLLCADVAKPQDIETLYEQATDFGPISLLVNNAAIMNNAGTMEDNQQWRQLMEVNFWSVLALQSLFLKFFIKQKIPSAIVNLGSKEGITTPPGHPAYNVSKAAIKVLTEQLAHELREKNLDFITAHLLIPGYTFTPMNFPNLNRETTKPQAAWTSDQVAERLLQGLAEGDFYIFCEDNETSWALDQCRMQWAVDDMILNRPALSRWHKDYREKFAAFTSDYKDAGDRNTH